MPILATDSGTLPAEDVFEILSNERRRMVLYYLRKGDRSAGVKELAEQIAAIENDVPVEELTSKQRKRVYVSLYQTHLPKMAKMSVIEYDKEEGIVHLTDLSDSIDKYLTSREESTYPWGIHHPTLAVISGVVLVLVLIGGPVVGNVPVLPLAAVALSLAVLSATAQYWRLRRQKNRIPPELRP
jgi:DNA-binding transcriptional ArsR family regulator